MTDDKINVLLAPDRGHWHGNDATGPGNPGRKACDRPAARGACAGFRAAPAGPIHRPGPERRAVPCGNAPCKIGRTTRPRATRCRPARESGPGCERVTPAALGQETL